MKHDYKQALDAVNKLGVMLSEETTAAIRSALELAIALQPKPISEAPRDGTEYVGVIGNKGIPFCCFYDDEESHGRLLRGHRSIIITETLPHRPTHYYDLSALPKVEETNED